MRVATYGKVIILEQTVMLYLLQCPVSIDVISDHECKQLG